MGNAGVTFFIRTEYHPHGVLAGLLIYTIVWPGQWPNTALGTMYKGNLLGFQVSGTGADASIFRFPTWEMDPLVDWRGHLEQKINHHHSGSYCIPSDCLSLRERRERVGYWTKKSLKGNNDTVKRQALSPSSFSVPGSSLQKSEKYPSLWVK